MSIIREPVGCWKIGTRLRKKSGSSWQGCVVGYYSTTLTPVGYAVESEREPGSVQIYPAAALEPVNETTMNYTEELAAFLQALDEWGCIDYFEKAEHILEFQRRGYDLPEYQERDNTE